MHAPSLKDIGIGKKRADHSRRLASVPAEAFVSLVDTLRQKAATAADRVSSCLSGRRVAEQIKATERGGAAAEFSAVIMPDDSWNFSKVRYDRIDGEDGHGYIPGDLYANCL